VAAKNISCSDPGISQRSLTVKSAFLHFHLSYLLTCLLAFNCIGVDNYRIRV